VQATTSNHVPGELLASASAKVSPMPRLDRTGARSRRKSADLPTEASVAPTWSLECSLRSTPGSAVWGWGVPLQPSPRSVIPKPPPAAAACAPATATGVLLLQWGKVLSFWQVLDMGESKRE
jgi:hypothetical protein